MARTCILPGDVVLSFSDVTFVLFCFVFAFFAFTEAAALRSIVLRSSICRRPDSHSQLPNNRLCPLVFCLFGEITFSEYSLYHCRFLLLLVWRARLIISMERTSYYLYGEHVLLLVWRARLSSRWCFQPCDPGRIFTPAYARIQSKSKSM